MCAVDYWVEKRNGQEEEGGMGKRWKIFYTQHNRLPRTRTDQRVAIKEQCSDPNTTAMSIYRSVRYTNTMDEEGKSNTSPFLNPKNTNHRRRSTSKGDVIVCCLSKHMFTVKEL